MTNHEINKAAEEYTDRFIPENKRCCKRYSKYCGATSSLFDVYGAFTEGAKWALEHQWNDVNKSLPDYEKDVIVTTDGKDCWFSHRSKNVDVMKDSHGFASFNWEEVMYWMEIPILKVK